MQRLCLTSGCEFPHLFLPSYAICGHATLWRRQEFTNLTTAAFLSATYYFLFQVPPSFPGLRLPALLAVRETVGFRSRSGGRSQDG